MSKNNGVILIRKTITVILVGVFLFTSTLGWAKEERLFSTAIENKSFSSRPADNTKLAPPSKLDSEDFRYSLTVGAICKHIEHDGNLNDRSYLNNVLARLDAEKNRNITVLPYEIIIEIPNEGLAVRYFDPTKANVITPYSDISKLTTKVIGPRLNRQIIHRLRALALPETLSESNIFADVEVRPDPFKLIGVNDAKIKLDAMQQGISTDLEYFDEYSHNLEGLLPYYEQMVIDILRDYPGYHYIVLGRDAELFYDALAVAVKGAYQENQVSLLPLSAPLRDQLSANLDKARAFISQFIDFQAALNGTKKYLIIDSGFEGTAIKWLNNIVRQNAGLADINFTGEANSNPLNGILMKSYTRYPQMTLEVRATPYPLDEFSLLNIIRETRTTYPQDKDWVNYIVACVSQCMPRYTDHVDTLVARGSSLVATAANAKQGRINSLPKIEDIKRLTNRDGITKDWHVPVHPLAAVLLQHRVVEYMNRHHDEILAKIRRNDERKDLNASSENMPTEPFDIIEFQREKDVIETEAGKELQAFIYELNPQIQKILKENNRLYPFNCGISAIVMDRVIKAKFGDVFEVSMKFGNFITSKRGLHIWLTITEKDGGEKYYLSLSDGQFKEYPGGDIFIKFAGHQPAVPEQYSEWYLSNKLDYVTFKNIRNDMFVEEQLGMVEANDQAKARLDSKIDGEEALKEAETLLTHLAVPLHKLKVPLLKIDLLTERRVDSSITWLEDPYHPKGAVRYDIEMVDSEKDILRQPTTHQLGNSSSSMRVLFHKGDKFPKIIVGLNEYAATTDAVTATLLEETHKVYYQHPNGTEETIDAIYKSDMPDLVKNRLNKIIPYEWIDIDLTKLMLKKNVQDLIASAGIRTDEIGDEKSGLINEQNRYIGNNKILFKDMLGENKPDTLVRIPVEAIESVGVDNIKDFLATFQTAPNGYVELYYMSSIGEVPESVYKKYALQKKLLPKDFKRTRENTITLFAALKGEEINQSTIVSRLGSVNVTPEDTILSPIGLQHDPAGLIRATVLGLKIMDIARQVKQGKLIDKDAVHVDILNQLRDVLDPSDFKNFDLTPDDIIALAIGNINNILTALKKLIKLLPITPINAEELRQIYEHVKAVITAA